MTEKRYEIVGTDDFFQHIQDNSFKEDKHEGAIYNIYEVVKKLNEQHEMIIKLQKENEELLRLIKSELKKGVGKNEVY